MTVDDDVLPFVSGTAVDPWATPNASQHVPMRHRFLTKVPSRDRHFIETKPTKGKTMSRDFRRLASALVLTLAVAACAASSSPTPGTPTPKATTQAAPTAQATTETSAAPAASDAAAICADAAHFRASMTALTGITLATVGVSGVTAALTDVQSAGQALAVSGRELVGQPINDLLTSVQALQTTLAGLADQPSLGAKLVAVKAAIEQIKTAASAVESALATTCPAN